MTYVMSDLHGCFSEYLRMLMHILFTEDDTLYILGDVIDRGEDGLKILKDAMARPNVHILRGNHEQMAMKALVACLSNDVCESDVYEQYALWLYNGGSPTVSAFCEQDAQTQKALLEYMHSMPVSRELTIYGRRFFLAHSVPDREKFLSGKANYHDYMWGNPEYGKIYREDTLIVTGHTPTMLIDGAAPGRIYMANNHIGMDCGVVFGKPLGCLCLDYMEEYYID